MTPASSSRRAGQNAGEIADEERREEGSEAEGSPEFGDFNLVACGGGHLSGFG